MVPHNKVCPTCGHRSGVRIVYGMPDFELFEQSERGLVALGGCIITDADPTWRCLEEECGAEW